jgi:uncharacterized repeat protein (TIGR02543 family)
MKVRKVSGSIAVCLGLLGLQGTTSEIPPTQTVRETVLTVSDSIGIEKFVEKPAAPTPLRLTPSPVQIKSKKPRVVKTSLMDVDHDIVSKQALPDCNYFGGMQTCEIRAIAEINPNSPNSVNPGGVVQGAGNLIDFKLGNKAVSPGNLVGPLHGFFEVPSTWTITGWTTGANWSCSGTAPVSGGAALPGSSFWGIYAAQADPPFNATQNNSVRCVYNGPKLAPGDVTATAVTFSVTVPTSATRWSSFFGASSEFLIGGQNGAVENNYQVINYMTLRYDINGGTGTTPGSELYNTTITQGNRTAASNSGFSKAGFTFGGWSCDNSIGTKQPGQSITWSNADVVCTAIWTPPAYQLSYNAGAGSGTVPTTVTGLNSGATPTLAAGTGVTAPANQTFTGWNCDNNIGAKNSGASVTMPAANVICTAKFTPTTPNVSPSSVDVREATNDSSSGKRGVDQILQPLNNDVVSKSSKWKPSSMRFCGPQQSAPKCTFRTVTVDGEGKYVVDTNGRVTFTPEPEFVGKATRVKYQVTDTGGRIVAANINVTVSGEGLPQSGNNSQKMLLLALLLISLGAALSLRPRIHL